MITIRFPSGFSVQYNSAGYLTGPDSNGITRIFTSEAAKQRGDCPIARVPVGCLIEFTQPCRTYNASGPPPETVEEVKALREKVEALAKKLKKTGAAK